MTVTIPDLWSEDIRVDVLTPLAILRTQEGLLAKRTKGIVQAQVMSDYTMKEGSGEIIDEHHLDLFAPALGFARERILSARHERNKVYPVTVTSEALVPEKDIFPRLPHPSTLAQPENQRQAATQEVFLDLVRQVLQSSLVRSLIQSFIARSNEMNPPEVITGSTPSDGGASPPQSNPTEGTAQD